MKSRMLNSIVVIAIFVVLAIPAMIAAQEPKSMQACGQSLGDGSVTTADVSSPDWDRRATATLRFLSFQSGVDTMIEWLGATDHAPVALSTIATNGSQPTVSLSPTFLSFHCGDNIHCFGCSGPKTVTLTNLGPGVLDISGITTSLPFSQTNTCGSTLDAGRSCTITVTRLGDVGNGTRWLSITDNAVGSPQRVELIYLTFCWCGVHRCPY